MIIKNFLRTTLTIVIIFLLIVFVGLIQTLFIKKNCTQTRPECPENYICNLNLQKCVVAEVCQEKKQDFCIALYDPVCSNGKEYSNSCVACSEGVKKYYHGKC